MICIVQRELTHYRVPFFIELSKVVQIKILFARCDSEKTKMEALKYPELFHSVQGWFFNKNNPYMAFLWTFSWFLKFHCQIIIHEMSLSMVNSYVAPLFARIFGMKLIWWGHGYNRFDKSGRKNFFRKIRIFLHKVADATIVYSEKGKTFLTNFGVSQEKVFVAWNSIDEKIFEEYRSLKNEIVRSDNEGLSFLFLGRLISEKKPIVVLQAFSKFVGRHPESQLHFVGAGPEESRLKTLSLEQSISNVYFHGEVINHSSLASILGKCDVLLNPGYLGLNVLHALLFGIPIITVKDGIDGVFHSPEAEYVEGSRAFFALNNATPSDFLECCLFLYDNPSRLLEAREDALLCSTKVSIKNMVNVFKKATEAV